MLVAAMGSAALLWGEQLIAALHIVNQGRGGNTTIPPVALREKTRTRQPIEFNLAGPIACLGDDFGDVFDLHLRRRAFVAKAVFEHGHAIGAGDGNGGGIELQGFLRPLQVDRLADVLVHPHPSAAGPAAEAVLAAARHLQRRLPPVAAASTSRGSPVHAVVPAQVAGIVEDDPRRPCARQA